MIIYVDMDGVLADFCSAAADVHGKQIEDIPYGQYELEKSWGLRTKEFWDAIDKRGEVFWEWLGPYPWTFDLVDLVKQYGEFYIATSPSRNPLCLSGKMKWIQRNFGDTFRNFFFGGHKYRLASPYATLIDDAEYQVDRFRKNYGAEALLFPQRWNRNYKMMDDPITYTKAWLEDSFDRI